MPSRPTTPCLLTCNVGQGMRNAFVISLVVMLGLVGAVAIVGGNWPAPENPPRQGEALDIAALEHGVVIHSQVAVSRLIREPQNTWSNLAFIAAGAYLVSRRLSRSARLVGGALIAVGIGSFLYHASASRSLRRADVAAMYGFFFATSALCVGSLSRTVGELLERRGFWLSIATLAVALSATAGRNVVVLGAKPFSLVVATVAASAILIPTLIVVALRRRSARTLSLVAAAVGLFSIAVICQIGDRPGGWLCAPGSVVQAHAVWHVLAAVAALLAVLALEKKPNQSSEPTPTAGTSAAKQPRVPAAVVAVMRRA